MSKQSGFSLIEVLIFITILALFFVVAAAVSTAALRNMKINEHKITATHYAQQLSGWINAQRESDWNTFITSYTSQTPAKSTYCFPDLNWNIAAGCDSTQKVDSFYTREAELTRDVTSSQIDVKITVSWADPGGSFNVTINNVYRLWE